MGRERILPPLVLRLDTMPDLHHSPSKIIHADRFCPRPAVNPLQARLFGVWTLMSAFVRLYAAYHIHSKPIYDLTIISYILALGHFASEALVFRTVGLKGVFFPFVVASSSLYWMITQYDFYVRL
ncbi:Ergosterol biosynthetic protein 28 [Rhodotorula toruloides]|nr:Ergosterol biosynthetic protein 28 [Rhodotorula toruloides]